MAGHVVGTERDRVQRRLDRELAPEPLPTGGDVLGKLLVSE